MTSYPRAFLIAGVAVLSLYMLVIAPLLGQLSTAKAVYKAAQSAFQADSITIASGAKAKGILAGVSGRLARLHADRGRESAALSALAHGLGVSLGDRTFGATFSVAGKGSLAQDVHLVDALARLPVPIIITNVTLTAQDKPGVVGLNVTGTEAQ